MKTRMLMADPDAIPRDAELMRYAIPRGRDAFAEHCAHCHGDRMHGDRNKGVPNLVDADWLYGSGRVGEIERIVLYGIRSGHSKAQKLADMPAFATVNPYRRYRLEPLDPREVDEVASLLYSFQHPHAADAAAVARGSEIYHGKGLCFDCHADHAKGDSAIGTPDLTDHIWLYGDGSMASIKAAISRGLAGVCPLWIGRLPPETIRAVALYVFSRKEAQ
ncbi:MAG: c-type cytochrome [Pseudomonadota bacterium]|nr:c-type cytochrome [Pseudomonadota bacterium]